MPPPPSTLRQALVLTALTWRFRGLNLVRLLRSLPAADRLIVLGGTPLVGLCGLFGAATPIARLSRQIRPEILAAGWFLGAAGLATALAWTQARALQRRFDRSWMQALPVGPGLRAQLIAIEQAMTGIAAVLGLGLLVGGIGLIAGAPAVAAQAGAACAGGAIGLSLGAGLAGRGARGLRPRSDRPVLATPRRNPSRQIVQDLLSRLDRTAPRWCGHWALGGREPFIDTGLIWPVVALAAVAPVAAAVAGASEAGLAACGVLSHLAFIAILRSRLLRAPALRALPIRFGRAVFGILRGPMALSLATFCAGAAMTIAMRPRLAGMALAGLGAVAAADLAYLCVSLACRGRERLGFVNYLLAIAIAVSNLPQFGTMGELLLIVPGLGAMVWSARRRFLALR